MCSSSFTASLQYGAPWLVGLFLIVTGLTCRAPVACIPVPLLSGHVQRDIAFVVCEWFERGKGEGGWRGEIAGAGAGGRRSCSTSMMMMSKIWSCKIPCFSERLEDASQINQHPRGASPTNQGINIFKTAL